MKHVNMHEAKTHLSRLVEAAAQGEAFVIARAGKPLVKVVPMTAPAVTTPSRLGFLRCTAPVPDDFDRMGADEIEALFGAATSGP